jgi:dipeptide/tripeptide permease
MNPRRKRRFAILYAVVFLVSLAFPVVAGLSHNTEMFPKWWGVLDVSVAFVLAILTLVIFGFTGGKVDKRIEARHDFRALGMESAVSAVVDTFPWPIFSFTQYTFSPNGMYRFSRP